jgi:hypothetical protein
MRFGVAARVLFAAARSSEKCLRHVRFDFAPRALFVAFRSLENLSKNHLL